MLNISRVVHGARIYPGSMRYWARMETRSPTTFVAMRASFSSSSPETTRVKLRNIFKEYSEANYSQTLPSRVVKDVLDTADIDHNGMISVKEVQKLLHNIRATEEFTDEELQAWMHEAYDAPEGAKEVPVEKLKARMLEILKEGT